MIDSGERSAETRQQVGESVGALCLEGSSSADSPKVMIEFFCGTKQMGDTFRAAGWDVLTIDINPDLEPDMVADILHLKVQNLPERFRHPTVAWFSPPCTWFSVCTISRNFTNGKPHSSGAFYGAALAVKCLELIRDLKPKYWFIENPRGMLRKMPFMPNHLRRTVTYCQYGLKYQKPTDIWSNAVAWISRKPCHAGDLCHEYQPRSYKHKISSGAVGLGVQGLKDAKERGMLPRELCEEVLSFCQGESKVLQEVLI